MYFPKKPKSGFQQSVQRKLFHKKYLNTVFTNQENKAGAMWAKLRQLLTTPTGQYISRRSLTPKWNKEPAMDNIPNSLTN